MYCDCCLFKKLDVVVVIFIMIVVSSFFVGLCNEESTGKEHQIGKYVLEDLEFGSKEEAGKLFLDIFIDRGR